MAQLLEECTTPDRPKLRFIRDTALTALADKNILHHMNEGLVKKSKEGRQALCYSTYSYYGRRAPEEGGEGS